MQKQDRVKTNDARLGRIHSIDGDFAEVFFADGDEWIHVDDLQLANPGAEDQLRQEAFSQTAEYELRLQALYLRHAQKFDPLSGLTNARIEPDPHQLYVANAVVNKRQARMILADEVGLGKTIEAALVFAELKARGLVKRALIICPASLQVQWQTELSNKFNEEFTIIDANSVGHFSRGSTNPFQAVDFAICSLSFATRSKRREQIVEADWDFVAFDEAHRVRRYRRGRGFTATKAYELAEELEPLTPAILMLTATPMQLDPFELYSLLQVVEPGLFRSWNQYEQLRTQIPRVNDLIRQINAWAQQSDTEKTRVLEIATGLLGREELGQRSLENPSERQEVIDRVVELHPWAGSLVRNRKSEIGGFAGREAQQFGIEISDSEADLYHDVTSYIRNTYAAAEPDKKKAVGFLMSTYLKILASSPFAIYQSLGKRLEKLKQQRADVDNAPRGSRLNTEWRENDNQEWVEQLDHVVSVDGLDLEIAELELLHHRLGEAEDSKLGEFLSVIKRLTDDEPETKIVVFTTYLDTQRYLEDSLREVLSIEVETFHGSLSLEQKELAIRRFQEHSPILISSEAGGEGRNLQFASVIVNYDLPWNPMKVEQRIGRLDRRGQKHRVRVVNLFRRGTIEERVHNVLHDRIKLFEESVGSLEPILGQIEDQFENILLGGSDEEFDDLADKLDQDVAAAIDLERIHEDWALDRSSFRQDRANTLLEKSPLAKQTDLRSFIAKAFEFHGGTLNEHSSDGGEVLTLSPGFARRLRSRVDSAHGVFDHETALTRTDLDFFSMSHELIGKVITELRSDDRAAATAYISESSADGDYIEVYYELSSSGRNSLGEVIRHRVGADLEVAEEKIEAMPKLGSKAQASSPAWVEDALRVSREKIINRFSQFRTHVADLDKGLKEADLKHVERLREYRLDRFRDQLEQAKEWVERVEQSGSPNERRILPARIGRLRKIEESIKQVEDQADFQRHQILREASAPTMRTWAAALVISS